MRLSKTDETRVVPGTNKEHVAPLAEWDKRIMHNPVLKGITFRDGNGSPRWPKPGNTIIRDKNNKLWLLEDFS